MKKFHTIYLIKNISNKNGNKSNFASFNTQPPNDYAIMRGPVNQIKFFQNPTFSLPGLSLQDIVFVKKRFIEQKNFLRRLSLSNKKMAKFVKWI